MSTRNVEGFIGIANKQTMTDTQIKTLKDTTEANIKSSTNLGSIKKLVASAISETIAKSSDSIKQMIAATNSISIVNNTGTLCKMGSLNVSNIDMSIKVDAAVVAEKTNKITNDITQNVKNNITNKIEVMTKDLDSEKIGSTLAGMTKDIAAVAGKAIDATAKVINNAACGIGIANNCDQNTITKDENEVKKVFNLTDEFKFDDKNDIKNTLNNNVKADDITEIIAEIAGINKMDFINVCPTDVSFDKIKMNLDIKSLVQSKKINDIANKIAADYANAIASNIGKMFDHAKEKMEGDIVDLGDAASKVIDSAGNAVGNIASGALMGMIVPIIIAIVVIILLLVFIPKLF